MALTLQSRLELAGALAKVTPQLQRLHLLEKPKKRHRLRNSILVGGAIAAFAAVAAVACRRRGCCDRAAAGNGADAWATPPEQGTPDAEPDRQAGGIA